MTLDLPGPALPDPALDLSNDPDVIAGVLSELIAADPVRATVFGTIRRELGRPDALPWCARSLTAGGGVAARSDPAHPVCVIGDWSDARLDELAVRLRELPDLAGVAGPNPLIERLGARLPQPRRTERQRLFRLDELTPPTGVIGSARPADSADRAVLVEFYNGFNHDVDGPRSDAADDLEGTAGEVERALAFGGPWLWTLPSGLPVALATRQPTAGGSARVGPVYTPPEHRGHGYASAVTAAATRDILDERAIPVLFTDLANPVANAIYPRLGYYPVEDQLRLAF